MTISLTIWPMLSAGKAISLGACEATYLISHVTSHANERRIHTHKRGRHMTCDAGLKYQALLPYRVYTGDQGEGTGLRGYLMSSLLRTLLDVITLYERKVSLFLKPSFCFLKPSFCYRERRKCQLRFFLPFMIFGILCS